jgi:adenosylmethionine-8-amino-7-oxononanoate aminotransferase
MALGKGITGGYLAMSATAANDRVFDAFLGEDLGEHTLYHGHSYGGNALAAAVALEHLRILDDEDVLANVRERAGQFATLLDEHVAPLGAVAEVRQHGLMIGVELAPPADGLRWGRRVSAACVARGVLVRPLGDVIVIVPLLTTTTDEAERIVAVLRDSVVEVTAAAYPSPTGNDG